MNFLSSNREQNFLLKFSIITILAYQFYDAVFLNTYIVKLSCTLLVLSMIFYLWKRIIVSNKNIPFYNLNRWVVFGVFFSMIMAWIYKNQSLGLSFTVVARNILQIILFFYLWTLKPSQSILEKYILLFGFVYIILWSYAILNIPEIIFGNTEEDLLDNSRGMVRINFVGRGNIIMAFFLCLSKFKETLSKRWFLLMVVFFIFNFFQLTRQLILWTAVVGLVYMFWNRRKWLFGTILLVFILNAIYPINKIPEDSVLGTMIDLTEQQVKDKQSDGNIRIKEYKYFFTEWHQNPITFMFGTGQPHGASRFGLWYQNIIVGQQSLFLSDVGYASMFACYGFIGLLLWIIIYLKGLFFNVSSSLSYTRSWFAFMIFANFSADWYEKPDFLIPTMVCLYLMGQYKITKQNSIKSIDSNEV